MQRKRFTALTRPISCRFRPQTKARLKSLARRLQMKPSEIIRQAVERQLTTWQQDDLGAAIKRRKAGR
jgi:predicted transcriptional regulator